MHTRRDVMVGLGAVTATLALPLPAFGYYSQGQTQALAYIVKVVADSLEWRLHSVARMRRFEEMRAASNLIQEVVDEISCFYKYPDIRSQIEREGFRDKDGRFAYTLECEILQSFPVAPELCNEKFFEAFATLAPLYFR